MRLNQKGFTLIEVLAVIVILAMILLIAVPNVNKLINKSKTDNYNNLKNSIVGAAKSYISDYRYDISIIGFCSDYDKANNVKKNIKGNNSSLVEIVDSKVFVSSLVSKKYLKTSKGNISNPIDNKTLKFDSSYVVVKYNCSTKDYSFELNDNFLKWN